MYLEPGEKAAPKMNSYKRMIQQRAKERNESKGKIPQTPVQKDKVEGLIEKSANASRFNKTWGNKATQTNIRTKVRR